MYYLFKKMARRRSRSRSRSKSVRRRSAPRRSRSRSRSRSTRRRSPVRRSRSRSTRRRSPVRRSSPRRSTAIAGLTKYYLPGQTFRRGVCVARATENDCTSDLQCAWNPSENRCYKKFNLGEQPAGPALPVGWGM
jgi:hypothetical protein